MGATVTKTNDGVRVDVESELRLGNPNSYNLSDKNTVLTQFLETHYHDKGVRVECASFAKFETPKRIFQANSLADVAIAAFANHLPLVLKPDDIWGCIMYALNCHVNENSEELRDKFVSHTGQEKLIVHIDHFSPGQQTPEQWEASVFPEFSKQIREHIGEDIHSSLVQSFSTSSATDIAIMEITLMSSLQKYFTYMSRTACGIPWIELKGTKTDWANIRERAGKLKQYMTKSFAESWLSCLLPVLDMFVSAFDGKAPKKFWKCMVKRIYHRAGSGAYTSVSGWISLLFPYLTNSKTNRWLKQWYEFEPSDGPEPTDFPKTVSTVPVVWDYLGAMQKMNYHAGTFGYIQDSNSNALKPFQGWILSYDPQN